MEQITCKELIMKWFLFNTTSESDFRFGTHYLMKHMSDYGFLVSGKYYSPGTYDRKFRELREDFKYDDIIAAKTSAWYHFDLHIEEDITEEGKRKSREKHFIVRRDIEKWKSISKLQSERLVIEQ